MDTETIIYNSKDPMYMMFISD